MTPLSVPLPYPLATADEQRAINRVRVWVALMRHKMTKEYSRELLETELRKGLREGRLTLTIKAVEAADKHDDEIADAALRQVGAEMMGGRIVEGEGGLQIWAYYQRGGLRPPHKRPRGRRWYDDWCRNIGICMLVVLACREFGVRPTRNRAARRANKGGASGISLVVAALALGRNKIHLDEGSVQENLWFGLPGELVRSVLASRLAAVP